MMMRTHAGVQPQRSAIWRLATPPSERRMILAWRELTALDNWRFILCSLRPSHGRSFLATTRSMLVLHNKRLPDAAGGEPYCAATAGPSGLSGGRETNELETALASI